MGHLCSPPSYHHTGNFSLLCKTSAQFTPGLIQVPLHVYFDQERKDQLYKALRISIRIDIWIMLSDTDTICHTQPNNLQQSTAMLSSRGDGVIERPKKERLPKGSTKSMLFFRNIYYTGGPPPPLLPPSVYLGIKMSLLAKKVGFSRP